MANFINEDRVDEVRGRFLDAGMKDLKSRIRGMDIEHNREVVAEEKKVEPKYTKEETADRMVSLYKENVKQLPTHPPEDPKKENVKANTVASRANIRALSNSLANIRNGGFAGPTTEFTPSANGDVNPGRRCGYNALVVAGTEMTLEDYQEYVEGKFVVEKKDEKKKGRCWTGYKPTPGKEPYSPGSCVKEGAVSELKTQLMELQDISWQSIDKVMRSLAKEHNITPKELHKDFKSEEGMIPDEWIKEHRIKEDCGFIPLDEVVNLNKTGNVFDVTLMWRAHTRRLKFFWPSVKYPSNEDMQDQVDKFYPGGKLIAFYPSTNPGDNQINTIVVVPALSDSYNYWNEEDWDFMSEEATEVYDYICAEEGEPMGPVHLNEEGQFEVLIADHNTGEEKVVSFTEDMSGMSQKSGDKRSTESGAGMTAQGVAKYNRRTGGNLKTAVTTPPSKLKPGSKAAGRRKSFCARSRGWDGERGKAARKRWNC